MGAVGVKPVHALDRAPVSARGSALACRVGLLLPPPVRPLSVEPLAKVPSGFRSRAFAASLRLRLASAWSGAGTPPTVSDL